MKFNQYIPPKERIGLLMLVLLILSGHVILGIYEKIFGFTAEEKTTIVKDVLANNTRTIKNLSPSSNTRKSHVELPPIDPNIATIEKLKQYGISNYAANNLKKYRAAGGVFNNMHDLAKIYGIDSIQLKSMQHQFKFPVGRKRLLKSPTIPKKEDHARRALQYDSIDIKPPLKFNPNSAPHETLVSNGFSKFAANNLIKYREKGGKIYRDSDLLKIYGINTSSLSKILQNIQFENPTQIAIKNKDSTTREKKLVASHPNPNKELIIDLNDTDENQLMELNGIGPILSKRILEYGEKLGGFLEKEQLLEVYAITPELYENINKQITISGEVKKFYIPNLSFKAVLQHPYFDYESTKAVKNISILNFDEELRKLIDQKQLDHRVVPYLYKSNPSLINSK